MILYTEVPPVGAHRREAFRGSRAKGLQAGEVIFH